MPTFFFYRLIGEVRNLPREFWPYLKGSNIHTVDLGSMSLGSEGAVEFVKNLKLTKVRVINLSTNGIGSKRIVEFAKNLQDETKALRDSLVSSMPQFNESLKAKLSSI